MFCVADHVAKLRSGDKYLGLDESAYLAQHLGTPIAYYMSDSTDENRWKLKCVAHPKYIGADLGDAVSNMPIAHLLFRGWKAWCKLRANVHRVE
jgi:hypothetical protein